ncbi:LacI family DNA-binding transcriptional regulator [Agromyces laixinhei]|uniref:LacI family DNA-binding transcriptional regulator n=1 Tax=Agromyces laixinhei TaxID=2585717 RepID=UPI0012ED9AC2|nr:LacI family DNA-binding transcriptional regulator [Agromyces laixinhei]
MSNDAHTAVRRRPTQVDVARLAGVSQATVSQLLNETAAAPARILPETRQRIFAAVSELGYSANPIAQSLKRGRNFLLGFHTFENVFPADQHDFYYPFLLGVEAEAANRGFDLLLFSPGVATENRAARPTRRLLMADGCILLGRHVDRDALADLAREDFPFVFIGRREIPGAEVSYVGADYAAATEEVIERLTALGHRRFGYIGESDGGEQSEDRLAGFWRGIDAAGARDGSVKHSKPLTPDELRRWVVERGITAVLVEPGDDDSNVASLEAAAAAIGVGIPEDLSVVVLGDPSFTSTTRDWSRFEIPRFEMGRSAVQLLLGRIEGERQPHHELLDCRMIATPTIAGVRVPESKH